jgi:hypothetical protein
MWSFFVNPEGQGSLTTNGHECTPSKEKRDLTTDYTDFTDGEEAENFPRNPPLFFLIRDIRVIRG